MDSRPLPEAGSAETTSNDPESVARGDVILRTGLRVGPEERLSLLGREVNIRDSGVSISMASIMVRPSRQPAPEMQVKTDEAVQRRSPSQYSTGSKAPAPEAKRRMQPIFGYLDASAMWS